MADFFNRIIDSFVKRNNWSKTAQAAHYKRQYNTFDRLSDKYQKPNIPASTDMEDVSSAADFQRQTGQLNTFVYKTESSKLARLSTRREMSTFPEISFALGEIEDEAINFDANGDFMQLIIKNPRLMQNENILKNLNKEWQYVKSDLLEAHKNINEWWMDYMIDGELFFEKVVDPETAKERGIIKVKRLKAEYTHPRWAEIEDNTPYDFIHKGPNNLLIMPPQMVAYANSGLFDYPDRETKIVKSFLDYARIDYRKLKQLEDALVIYRLTRSVERRIFKIEVGKLPKQRAESYVQNLMKKYRQRKTYNPETGEASQTIDTMAMIEDYWFPQQDGKGSSIDTLPGAENLGQIDDVIYFLKKLYRALRIPMSRMEQDTGFSLGDTSDITREEVRFNKMVQKFVNRFSDVFLQIFISHLRLKGYADEYGINEKDFFIKMHSNNLFQDYIESELIKQRVDNFEKFIPYSQQGEDGSVPLFDKEWLMRRFLKLANEDILENESYIKKNKNKKIAPSEGGGGSGGSGDLGGSSGGNMGGSSSSGGSETSDALSELGPAPEGSSDITGTPPETKSQETNTPESEPKSGLDSFA